MTVLGSVLGVGGFALLLIVWAWCDAYGRRKLARARAALLREKPLGRSRIGL